MEKQKLLYATLISLVVFSVLFITFNTSSLNSQIINDNKQSQVEGVQYHSSVCVLIKNPDGTIREDKGCSHNLVTTAGLNLIKDKVGSGTSSAAVNYIALCNATAGCTAPAAGDTSLTNEFAVAADAAGVNRSAGTYGSVGNGNWSMSKEFTALADNIVTNKTALFNASTGGTEFAANTFTLATLQTNDKLNITWYIWVTSA